MFRTAPHLIIGPLVHWSLRDISIKYKSYLRHDCEGMTDIPKVSYQVIIRCGEECYDLESFQESDRYHSGVNRVLLFI